MDEFETVNAVEVDEVDIAVELNTELVAELGVELIWLEEVVA